MKTNLNSNNVYQEWKALSSTDDVLFYNKKKHRIESMSYKNGFQRFFKIIWYYMRGYTRNSDTLFKGIEDLVSRSIRTLPSEGSDKTETLSEMERTIRKVQKVTMAEMMERYKKEGKSVKHLAAKELSHELEQLLKSLAKEKAAQKNKNESTETKTGENRMAAASPLQQKAATPGKEEIKSDDSTIHSTSDTTGNTITLDRLTQSLPAHPMSAPAVLTKGPPAPKAPQMMSPEEKKAAQIKQTTKEIDAEKPLVEYLRLLELKNHKDYKTYENARSNQQVYINKSESHKEVLKNISLEDISKEILSIERQLGRLAEDQSVMINQDGKPTPFPKDIAEETLKEWKAFVEEVKTTQKKLAEYTHSVEEAAKVVIKEDGFSLNSKEIDDKIENYQKAIPEAIKENKGLKFHQTKLEKLETKLQQLNGEPVATKKKPTPKLVKYPTMPITKKELDKALIGDIASSAQLIIAAKKKAKPSLAKLFSQSV